MILRVTIFDVSRRLSAAALLLSTLTASADPRVTSWITDHSGAYARLYETDAELTSGTSKTTWTRGSINQALPAYSGVQAIYSSTNAFYVRTSGLGLHVMGPWYLNAARTQLFPNLPANQNVLYSFPLITNIPPTRSLTSLGAIGYFVDGVAMFDGQDGFSWNTTNNNETGGQGIWNRDAYVNEGVTFDPGFAHQEQSGTYHYHANPPALRYLLGDHITFNSLTKYYSENPTNLHHSPILGWVRDGNPVYGPYGYDVAMNATSTIRRMRTGFVPRNGANGTTNLAVTGRTSLPPWAARAQNRLTTLSAGEYGPSVNATYPLGRYQEDNDYLGDLGSVQGVAFDLDEFNGRWCVTPEFPNGTYAYFVSITTNGTPAFPYNIGRRYYGTPTGTAVQTITETVATNFVGGPDTALRLTNITYTASTVTLVWSATEGGTYKVESSTDLVAWVSQSTNAAAVRNSGAYTNSAPGSNDFYRVKRTALASYDVKTTLKVVPNVGTRGTSVQAVITLDTAAGVPPQQAPINSITIGSIAGTGGTRLTQYIITNVVINIPTNAVTGPQTVSVVFPGPPPPSATNIVTFAQPNGFTIQ